jgi:RNA polymerase sigma-70 factor, ECF subfamily
VSVALSTALDFPDARARAAAAVVSALVWASATAPAVHRPAGRAARLPLPSRVAARRVSPSAAAAHRPATAAHPAAAPMTQAPAALAFQATLAPLWAAAQAGDEVAYRAALDCIARRLRVWLRRHLQSLPDEVEDLLQETLLALHLHRGSHDPSVPVSAWVHAIARHKLVDLWRRRGRREAMNDTIDDLDEHILVSEETEAAGTRRDLVRLLDRLPEAQRQAIVLTKLEGLSVAEAAERTGASEAAIKVQVHRGLKKLTALVQRA